MHFTFLFADSEVQLVQQAADRLTVRFSAAHVQRLPPSVPFASEVEHGYARSLVMALEDAHPSGTLQECVGRLADGHLYVGGRRHSRLPLPFEAEGPLRCELEFRNGTVLVVTAALATCRFEGDPRFMESYAC